MSDVDNSHTLDKQDLIAAARQLWGKETKHSKTEWRFGKHGSKSIRLDDLVWFDHELGLGGGIVELCEKASINGAYHNPANPKPKQRANNWKPETPPGPAPINMLGCNSLFTYRAANGNVLCYVRRFEQPRKFLPLTWGSLNESVGWHMKAPLPPLPLYNLADLHELTPDLVILCEGEKAADAANAKISTENLPWLAISWMGGAGRAKDADLSPLAGRKVVIWPDADEPGLRARDTLMEMLPEATALNTEGLPEKFDAADLKPEQNIKEFVETRTKQKPPSLKKSPTQGKPAKGPQGWLRLCMTGKGGVLNNVENIHIAMTNDTGLVNALAFNEMTRTITVQHAIGNPKQTNPHWPRDLADHDYTTIQRYLQRAGLRQAGRENIIHVTDEFAHENPYHPIRKWLGSLAWDKTERLTTWLETTTGADDRKYLAEIGRMFVIAMTARIFEPGCKADYMIVLEGGQAEQKSKMCRLLAGNEWFSDHLPDITSGKDASLHLRGKWLIEIAEMHAFNRAEATQLKQFISRQTEQYRPPYGRIEIAEPRQNLFIGTTNKEVYLKDETGGRRFWPLKVKHINLDWLTQNRSQIFAEAVHAYREGRPWWPDRAFEQEFIQPKQEDRYDADAWEEQVAEYVKSKDNVTILEVAIGALDYGKPKITTPYGTIDGNVGSPGSGGTGTSINRLTRTDQSRIAAILSNLRWVRGPRQNTRRTWIRRVTDGDGL